MYLKDYHQFRRQLRKAWRGKTENGDSDIAIRLLNEMIYDTESDLKMLYSDLAGEFGAVEAFDKVEAVHRHSARMFPDDPGCQISLLEHLIWKDQPEDALKHVDHAISVALNQGNMVRDAYNQKARIAVRLGNVSMFEEALKFLIDYIPPSDSLDIHYEHDFIQDFDLQKYDPDLIEAYLKVSGGLPK